MKNLFIVFALIFTSFNSYASVCVYAWEADIEIIEANAKGSTIKVISSKVIDSEIEGEGPFASDSIYKTHHDLSRHITKNNTNRYPKVKICEVDSPYDLDIVLAWDSYEPYISFQTPINPVQ